ncbi:MAG: hypothetical protein RMJ66_08040 [Bacteroidia bacterium]|nr:hypothetical protein [Bacteroidia bacterium]
MRFSRVKGSVSSLSGTMEERQEGAILSPRYESASLGGWRVALRWQEDSECFSAALYLSSIELRESSALSNTCILL